MKSKYGIVSSLLLAAVAVEGKLRSLERRRISEKKALPLQHNVDDLRLLEFFGVEGVRMSMSPGTTPSAAPVVPATPAPVVPATPAPVVPATPAPVVPATPAPVVPATPAPFVPATPAPVVPATPAPVVPATPAPVVPATPAPVVPATAAPVVPFTPAPVVPPTLAPVIPATPAPVVPPTLAPVTPAPIVPPTLAPVVTPAPIVPATPAPQATPATQSPTQAPQSVTSLPTAFVCNNDTLYDIAAADPELGTAVVIANLPYGFSLLNILQNESSATPFLPTNAAFQATDQDYLALLATTPYGLHLYSLLGYHTAPQILFYDDIVGLNGTDFNMSISGSVEVLANSTGVFLESGNGPVAQVEDSNIRACNGIMHKINALLQPAWFGWNLVTYMELFDANVIDRYSTTRSLLVKAGLEDDLSSIVNATFFAPTNEAFTEEVVTFLSLPENLEVLKSVLAYHVSPQLFNFMELTGNSESIATLQGEAVTLKREGADLLVNDATVQAYATVRYGLLYRINALLIPPSLESTVPYSPPVASSTSQTGNARKVAATAPWNLMGCEGGKYEHGIRYSL